MDVLRHSRKCYPHILVLSEDSGVLEGGPENNCYSNINGPDSENTYAGVSTDTQRKCPDAPSYLCACILTLDTPEIWLQPTDVSLSTPSYLGCIFTLAARGASVDLCVEYANDLDTPIHERTCASRI